MPFWRYRHESILSQKLEKSLFSRFFGRNFALLPCRQTKRWRPATRHVISLNQVLIQHTLPNFWLSCFVAKPCLKNTTLIPKLNTLKSVPSKIQACSTPQHSRDKQTGMMIEPGMGNKRAKNLLWSISNKGMRLSQSWAKIEKNHGFLRFTPPSRAESKFEVHIRIQHKILRRLVYNTLIYN